MLQVPDVRKTRFGGFLDVSCKAAELCIEGADFSFPRLRKATKGTQRSAPEASLAKASEPAHGKGAHLAAGELLAMRLSC